MNLRLGIKNSEKDEKWSADMTLDTIQDLNLRLGIKIKVHTTIFLKNFIQKDCGQFFLTIPWITLLIDMEANEFLSFDSR